MTRKTCLAHSLTTKLCSSLGDDNNGTEVWTRARICSQGMAHNEHNNKCRSIRKAGRAKDMPLNKQHAATSKKNSDGVRTAVVAHTTTAVWGEILPPLAYNGRTTFGHPQDCRIRVITRCCHFPFPSTLTAVWLRKKSCRTFVFPFPTIRYKKSSWLRLRVTSVVCVLCDEWKRIKRRDSRDRWLNGCFCWLAGSVWIRPVFVLLLYVCPVRKWQNLCCCCVCVYWGGMNLCLVVFVSSFLPFPFPSYIYWIYPRHHQSLTHARSSFLFVLYLFFFFWCLPLSSTTRTYTTYSRSSPSCYDLSFHGCPSNHPNSRKESLRRWRRLLLLYLLRSRPWPPMEPMIL